jgi:hypothetical protein
MDPLDDRLTRAGRAWREDQVQPAVRWSPAKPAQRRRSSGWPGLGLRLTGVTALMVVLVGVTLVVAPRDPSVVVPLGPTDGDVITLLTAREPEDFCLHARAAGRLVRSEVSGLGLDRGDGSVIVVRWPYGYRAEVVDGVAVLRDERGVIVAREGDAIASAGGYAGDRFHACGSPHPDSRTAPPYLVEWAWALDAEGLAALVADPPDGDRPAVVLVDATIAPLPPGADRACADADDGRRLCAVGTVAPEGLPVFSIWADADGDLVDQPPPGDLVAIRVAGHWPELLGPVQRSPDGGPVHTVAEALALGEAPVGSTIAVTGVLVRESRRCPLAVPGRTSPFQGCRDLVLTTQADPATRLPLLEDPASGSTPTDTVGGPPIAPPGSTSSTYLIRRIVNDVTEVPPSGWLLVRSLESR